MALVYLITNTVNNKHYVGATITPLDDRWSRHKCDATHNRGNMAIHAAIRKYGPDAFTVQLLEEHQDENHVFEVLEPKYIDQYQSMTHQHGYNQTRGGDGWLGMKHTPETIEKMRKAKLGKKASEETKRKMSLANKGRKAWNKGKKCPELGSAWRGKCLSDEHKKNVSESRRGTKHSAETRKKTSDKLAATHVLRILSTGELIEVTNLRQFCKQYGLSQGNLVAHGQTKGYQLVSTTKTVRAYTLRNTQDGTTLVGDNLKKLCNQAGISNSGLLTKYNDGNRPYRGWIIENIVETRITQPPETHL
jgi:group I intron endonuclease